MRFQPHGSSCAHRFSSDLVSALFLSFVFIACVNPPAYAYVDPSVMTYTIQALAGVAVALSAAIGVFFRRTRRKIFQVLHIDEESRKAKDPAVVMLDPVSDSYESSLEEARTAAQALTQASAGKVERPLSWRARFVYALIVSVFASFTLLVAAPSEIVAANPTSLIFGVHDVWWILALFGLAVAAILSFALSAFRKKAFDTALVIVFCFGLLCWLQALFINEGLPTADGRSVNWGNFQTVTIVSTVVWVALLSIPPIIAHWHHRTSRLFATVASVCLIIVQGVGFGSLFVNAQSNLRVTEEGLFEVSPQNNVIVFVLDTYDTRDANSIMRDDPHFFDALTGFTYYGNVAGSMIPTHYAVPFLLTNQLPQPEQTWGQYYANRYANSTFLDDISDAGYNIGIYTDSAEMDFNKPADLRQARETLNIHELSSVNVDPVEALLSLEQCAFFRDMPWLLKSHFWFYTDEVNQRVVATDLTADPANIQYHMNDGAYHEALDANGLTIKDDGGMGSFRFIHLLGAHYPVRLNAEGYTSDSASYDDQIRGSMKIVFDYIQDLKDLGLYDDATIIITADHGVWHITDENDYTTAPMLFVKPSQTSEEAQASLKKSNLPVSHCDIPATVIEAIGDDPAPYGTVVYESADPNRTRYFYALYTKDDGTTSIHQIEIDPDKPLSLSGWHETGLVWD